jgi:hypothetical protein
VSQEIVDDVDKSASLGVGATPRRSTSSLGPSMSISSLRPMTLVFAATLQAAAAADFSTPIAALNSLEEAYVAKSIEAAVAAKDFGAEAREILQSVGGGDPKIASDPGMIKDLTHILDLAYRKEIAEKGFPDMSKPKCEKSQEEARRVDLIPIREICQWPDGHTSNELVFAVKTVAGWKIIYVPDKRT